jgi:hypothetical protein
MVITPMTSTGAGDKNERERNSLPLYFPSHLKFKLNQSKMMMGRPCKPKFPGNSMTFQKKSRFGIYPTVMKSMKLRLITILLNKCDQVLRN